MQLPAVQDVGFLPPEYVPDFVEKILGDLGEKAAVEEFGGVVNNPAAVEYVTNIGRRLVLKSKRSKFGYKFGVVADTDANAFALPNGSVYVTMGFLKLIRNDAQLAAILAHEIGHVVDRHSLEQVIVDMGALGAAHYLGKFIKRKVGKEEANLAEALSLALISSGYSRKSEWEADEIGQKLMSRAGYDPVGMVDVMNVFKTLEGQQQGGIERYLRSHPYADERLVQAQKRSRSLPHGEVGEESYKDFLANVLGVPTDAVELSPVEAAPAALSTGLMDKLTSREFLEPFAAIAASVAALTVLVIFLRRRS
jgi:predicted Zn-dependent protease